MLRQATVSRMNGIVIKYEELWELACFVLESLVVLLIVFGAGFLIFYIV
jgi:hypothetical protein